MATDWLDFNDAESATRSSVQDDSREAIRLALIGRLDAVLTTLFPAGKVRRGKFVIGDALGSPGDSLEVVLTGEKAGLWTDRAENTGGDIFDLIAAHHRLDAQIEFARVLEEASRLLGRAQTVPTTKPKKAPPMWTTRKPIR